MISFKVKVAKKLLKNNKEIVGRLYYKYDYPFHGPFYTKVWLKWSNFTADLDPKERVGGIGVHNV